MKEIRENKKNKKTAGHAFQSNLWGSSNQKKNKAPRLVWKHWSLLENAFGKLQHANLDSCLLTFGMPQKLPESIRLLSTSLQLPNSFHKDAKDLKDEMVCKLMAGL